MSFRVLLRPEAEADIGDAATWYEEQKAGLGREFVDAVFHAIDGLSANPCSPSVVIAVGISGGFFQTGSPTG